MKRILSILLVLSFLLPCIALADEAPEEERAEGCAYMEDYPSRCVTFTYPAKYKTYASRSAGYLNIYYDDDQYVAVWMQDPSLDRLDNFENRFVSFSSNRFKHTSVYILTDQMCAAGVFCDTLIPSSIPLDYLEFGITSDNGYYFTVQANCYTGQITGCYDLLLDILGNFVDAELVENWLNEVWYPQVLAAEEDQ